MPGGCAGAPRGGTSGHYDRLANVYDRHWAHSSAFVSWMNGRIVDYLRPVGCSQVVDLGCGTGLYCRGLGDVAARVICVDPCAAMLARLPEKATYIPVQATAEDLAAGRSTLPVATVNRLLIKDAVHHFCDPASTLAGLARLLADDGRLLIVMLPTRIEYPLFRAALRLFESLQPHPEAIAGYLRDAGLQTSVSYESFRQRLPTHVYLDMVKSRYLSVLSEFDDDELAAGVDEIRKTHRSKVLCFTDRFAFVLGRKRVW
ncbi:class I SAM-dependent methyltransferase [Mycobacterium sp. SM1]|uniref:class I SAM-dependent methyltransferase n=1 Tax=Mycobacterium sp. SM1 TaxID=2816243 RepID=UPI001BD10D0E|nr:class I SAM-dependent methyltransferase [Mycobacterium sp. SM1]MBS4727807.1 class I SAM-dependent methyltransferase [Mycobacterium sp. SM1]